MFSCRAGSRCCCAQSVRGNNDIVIKVFAVELVQQHNGVRRTVRKIENNFVRTDPVMICALCRRPRISWTVFGVTGYWCAYGIGDVVRCRPFRLARRRKTRDGSGFFSRFIRTYRPRCACEVNNRCEQFTTKIPFAHGGSFCASCTRFSPTKTSSRPPLLRAR